VIAEAGPVCRAHILTLSLWWGITMMVVAAMVALFARPRCSSRPSAASPPGCRRAPGADVLKDIELPLPISWIASDVGASGCGWARVVRRALAARRALDPFIMVLALIAVSSTALTGITPSSSLSKIPQFAFGALDRAPRRPTS